jgi:hypothetical protein
MPAKTKIELDQPTDARGFARMMEEVDAHLRRQGVAVHARPMLGWVTIGTSLGQSLRLVGSNFSPLDGVYVGDSLTARIFRWFEFRYADKLKTRFGPGRIVVLIRDDPWELNLPKIWGSVQFVISRKRTSDGRPQISKSGPCLVNILDLVEELPHGLRDVLTHEEMEAIGSHFIAGFEAMSSLYEVGKRPLIAQALSDFDIAVQCLIASKNYGNARWAALQACEKSLKAFIEILGGQFPRSHNLQELANIAKTLGLEVPRVERLASVQIGAGVRYGEIAPTLSEAFAGYWASLEISGGVAKAIARVDPTGLA